MSGIPSSQRTAKMKQMKNSRYAFALRIVVRRFSSGKKILCSSGTGLQADQVD
jgi:hypothetical protein